MRPPPTSTLFPYTTLFRSHGAEVVHRVKRRVELVVLVGTRHARDEPRQPVEDPAVHLVTRVTRDRKSTRLNSSHSSISYAVFCLKKKKSTTRSSLVTPCYP